MAYRFNSDFGLFFMKFLKSSLKLQAFRVGISMAFKSREGLFDPLKSLKAIIFDPLPSYGLSTFDPF